MKFLKPYLLAAVCSFFVGAQAQQWKTFTPGNSGLPFRKIYTMEVDTRGRVWVGTNSGASAGTGLAYFDNDTIYPVGPNTGLVYGICARENAIWFIMSSYMLRLDNTGWTYPTPDPSLGVGMLAYADPVVIDGQQTLWMKPSGGGLLKLEGNTWSVYKAASSALPTDQIRYICTSGNALWMATASKGLARHEGGIFTSFTTGNSSIPSDSLTFISKGSGSTLWMLSKNNHLIRYDGALFTSFTSPELHSASALHVDRSSVVWIGTSHGLVRFDGTAFSTFSTTNSGLSDDMVLSLKDDTRGNLWIGTFTGGLCVYNPAGVQTAIPETRQQETTVSIYPNPATDKLFVNLSSPVNIKGYRLTDITGKTQELLLNGNEIDLKNLNRGLYMLEVQTDHTVIRKQFFRQ